MSLSSTFRSALLQSICFVVAIAGFAWLFPNIVLYLGLSLVLSILLRPFVNILNNIRLLGYRMHRSIAIIFSFLCVLSLMSLVSWTFLPLVGEQINLLSRLDFEELSYELTNIISQLELFLIRTQLTQEALGFLNTRIANTFDTLIADMDIASVLNYFIGLTGGLFMGLLSVFFITFLFLYEQKLLYRSMIAFVPNRYFEIITSTLFKVEKRFVSYLGSIFMQISILFTLIAVGLIVIGVEYVVTIALFSAFANLIPYLGPIFGAAFAFAVGFSSVSIDFLSYDTLILAVRIVVIFLTVQIIDNFLVQPVVFARSIQAHPIEIFLIIFAGSTLGGIPGMIAAIPVYTILKVSISEVYKGILTYRLFN